MKRLITILMSVLIINTLFATPIDEKTALKAAGNFHQLMFPTNKKLGIILNLAYKCTSQETNFKKTDNSNAYYFVYNAGNEGFIIVAGDDASLPILGYSTEGSFNFDQIPQNVAKWLEGYKQQIRYIVENNLQADETITSEWQKILNGQPLTSKGSKIAPLIQTKWDQSPFVNDLCPLDYTFERKVVTGCVATAMAQIMKYWEYPQKGFGFHSYNHDRYGTLSVNFSDTYYQWDNMPNVVNSTNNAVATLMYHCGVSIDMNYNVSELGGSGANTLDVADALKEYFGYSTSVNGVSRKNFSDSEWIQLLKNELNEGRPIQYAGSVLGGGGHSFVCDGYDANNFFHFNWGWSGSSDGYFLLNALNPGSIGTGGGEGGYNTNQRAVIGIKPPDVNQTYNLEINQDVVSDKSTISFGEGFTISTDILNDGENAFAGDFCAAAFDENGVFVDFVEILSNRSLGVGYHYTNGVSFTTEGMVSLLPGTYKIHVFYRATGGNWVGMKADYWSLLTKDYTTIKVTNENDFRLYSSMALTPSQNIYSGQSLSVWLDVANFFNEQFNGTIDVSLFTLEGKFAATIEQKTSLTLNANSHYTNGLTFTTSNLNVEPGTYLLAVRHKWDGYGWELTGSTTSYINPIKVIVQAPPYLADSYENNNEIVNAYSLNTSFSGNTTTIKTVGSNAHIGTDYDFYKVTLAAGYNYKINPRLQDAYNNNDGQQYSLDALFAYSLDGINWSDAYDDVLESEISISGAKTIYFWVSPYFSGQMGTYELDINLVRSEIANLTVSNTALTIGSLANSTQTFNITSNVGWSVASNESWLSVDKTAGTSNSTITLTASANPNATIRTAKVTVSGTGVSDKIIDVTQEAKITTGINDINETSLKIYPNPLVETLTIENMQLNSTIMIFDISGKLLINKTAQSETEILDVSHLTSGIYTIRIQNEELVQTSKLIKQ